MVQVQRYLHITSACVKAPVCLSLGRASATVVSVRVARITCFSGILLGRI